MRKKIIGNPTTTPYPRPDWNQTDETKADYIKNKRDAYPYKTVDMADVIGYIWLSPNEVTYAHGIFGGEEINLYVDNASIENDVSEESVLILDLSSMSEIHPISISGGANIKWLNGEPPTIEAGKVYMFSFVRAKTVDKNPIFFLGVGGEFA